MPATVGGLNNSLAVQLSALKNSVDVREMSQYSSNKRAKASNKLQRGGIVWSHPNLLVEDSFKVLARRGKSSIITQVNAVHMKLSLCYMMTRTYMMCIVSGRWHERQMCESVL